MTTDRLKSFETTSSKDLVLSVLLLELWISQFKNCKLVPILSIIAEAYFISIHYSLCLSTESGKECCSSQDLPLKLTQQSEEDSGRWKEEALRNNMVGRSESFLTASHICQTCTAEACSLDLISGR